MIKGSKYFMKNYHKNSIFDNFVRFLGWPLPRGTNLLPHYLFTLCWAKDSQNKQIFKTW